MDQPKYPHITVCLTECDSNAFSIIGAVSTALRENDVCKEEIQAFKTEAMSSDYDHLIQTCLRWVEVS